MCCPYMFVTINALPYVLGKKIQAYGKKKKKKKIQVKGENNMTRQKKITTSHYSQNIMIKILLSNRLYISI